jgi:alkanesulfonate monooxygenase SsuD/methylene tetrahydromethanopterin reductase-like flavin-dependent oxidoreductase (luciferase family)
VALDGLGWHPAAWRASTADPRAPFTPGYWVDLVAEAERGLLDLVTVEDSPGLQSTRPDGPDGRVDRLRGRLDAVQVAARVAPVTRHIGLVPAVDTIHTEPFHVSTAVATLDHVSQGRAGWRPQASARSSEARHFGRRELPELEPDRLADPPVAALVAELFAEAADAVEVVRRLWDSWQDDAVIRDLPTGRFVDRDRLHYTDFTGRWFSVRGPSIVPRPPQGQPVVAVLAHGPTGYAFAAGSADLVLVTPVGAGEVETVLAGVRGAEAAAGRAGPPLRVLADLAVLLAETPSAARRRRDRLDTLAGSPWDGGDAPLFTGTPGQLADLAAEWHGAGVQGFRLRPAVLPEDLTAITRALVPALQERGLFRSGYPGGTLRDLLGLPRPTNRYTPAAR